MEQLHNGYTLELCQGAFPLSTDSMALANFVKLPVQANILDLGSGCGTLGLLLCAKDSSCRVTGLELSENAHLTALENIHRNGLQSRMESICADIRSVSKILTPGSFSVCVSNPPYFSSGPASATVPIARREDCCSMEDIFRAAAWAVKYGGDLFIVHRPERLAELMHCACTHQLEPKRLCLLRHRPESPVSLVLLQCRKGAKPGLIWEEMNLHMSDGSPSAHFKQIYHL